MIENTVMMRNLMLLVVGEGPIHEVGCHTDERAMIVNRIWMVGG